MENFRKLTVWTKAKDLAVNIYKLTLSEKISRDFSFRDQIRRSALSIPSNIAEGNESGFAKLTVRFLYVAKGSAAELSTQLAIGFEIGYLDEGTYKLLQKDINEVTSMLQKLIAYKSKEKIK